MICPECLESARQLHHGYRNTECRGCRARMLLRSPMGMEAFIASQESGRLTHEYREQLRSFDTDHEHCKEQDRAAVRSTRVTLA